MREDEKNLNLNKNRNDAKIFKKNSTRNTYAVSTHTLI